MMEDSPRDPLQLLEELGFSPVEAAVYCELLRRPGISGYRVARGINKAQGNTYQALASLTEKGAVLPESGEPRTYRAVPIKEVITRLRRGFEARCEAAEQSLKALEGRPPEGVIVSLNNPDQVFERAAAMISKAEATLIFELFQGQWNRLADPLAKTGSRLGRACAGLVIAAGPMEFGDVNAGVSRISDLVLRTVPFEQMAIVVDGRELLIAALNPKTGAVLRAVWANDLFLSYLMHNGLVADIIMHRSDFIEQVGSPNRHLLGRLPPTFDAIAEKRESSSPST